MAYKIAIIIGSLRKDSLNRRVARSICALRNDNLDCSMIEIGDLPLYNQDLDSDPPEQVAEYAARQPIDLGPQYRRGRHIAASNCAECHGPDLGGGEAEPGLDAPDLTIAGAYDEDAFKALIRTGVPPGGRKLKMMGEVAIDDLSRMSDAEIADLHAYLQARAQQLSR